MPITIGQNIYSFAAGRRLANASEEVAASSQRLASGLRINRPSDDAAGLAVSSTLRARARVFSQGLRNFSDAQSFLAIGEGALNNLSNVTIRLRELATQAANGSFSRTQRLSLQNESDELTKEFNRVIATTSFNGLKSLDRSLTSIRFQGSFGSDGGIDTSLAQSIARARGTGKAAASSTFGVNSTTEVSLDINGDGKLDLVSSSSAAAQIRVYLGSGDGTFSPASPATLATSYSSAQLAVGDFNGDGKQDVAALSNNAGGLTTIQIFSNVNGSLTLTDTKATGGQFGFSSPSVSDLNNDGRSDIVLSNLGGAVVSYLGQSGGTLGSSLSTLTTVTNATTTLGDLNGDGIPDLIATDPSDLYNSVLYFGLGNGKFSTSGRTISNDSVSTRIADLDRDGRNDIVLEDSSGNLQFLKGDGSGGFTQSSLGITLGTLAFSILDVDGDGYLDIASADTATLSVFRGRGNGIFDNAITSAFTGVLGEYSSGDFNGDGIVDFGGIDTSGNLQIGLQTTTSVGAIKTVTLATQSSARDAMSYFDDLLTRIGAELGNIGASQSRLSSAFNALSAERENSQSAAGRIQDADVASETARLVRSQILQQVGSAILGQANQLPRIALELLRGI